MVGDVVEFIQLKDVAEFGFLGDDDHRLVVYQVPGFEGQVERQLSDELVVHVQKFVIYEKPDGEAVRFARYEVPARWAAQPDLTI